MSDERDQLVRYIRALRAFEKVRWSENELEPQKKLNILRVEFTSARADMSQELLDEIEND